MKKFLTLAAVVTMAAWSHAANTTNSPVVRDLNSTTLYGKITNIVVVSAAGNDTTGARNNVLLPFATITAAKAAAYAGDTIRVMPGSYNEANLLKVGVNYYFDPGTLVWKYYTTTNDGTEFGIFDDRSIGATTNTIGGFGSFQTMTYTDIVTASSQLVNSNMLGTIVMTNPSTRLVISCNEIQASRWLSSAIYGFCVYTANGFMDLRCEKMWDPFSIASITITNFNNPHTLTRTSHGGGLYWEQGQIYVKCSQNIPASTQYGIWGNGVTTSDAGDLWYDGDLMTGKIYTSFLSTNSRDWIHIRTFEINTNTQSSLQTAASFNGSGKHYLSCDKIQSNPIGSAAAIDGFTNGGVSNSVAWVTAQKLSSSNAFFNVTSGTVNAEVLQLEDLGGGGGTTISGNGVLNLAVNQKGVVTVTTTATVTFPQGLVRADTTSAGFTVTLPATPFHGEKHQVKKISSDGNTLTVSGGGHNIDGSATKTTTTQYASYTVTYDAVTATWNIQ